MFSGTAYFCMPLLYSCPFPLTTSVGHSTVGNRLFGTMSSWSEYPSVLELCSAAWIVIPNTVYKQ